MDYEQRVPAWDRTIDQNNNIAVLDVVVSGPGGRQYVDVTVVDALAAQGPSLNLRATVDGVAARDREREKHARYPGPALVAAAMESGGRMGEEFHRFLKAHAPPSYGGSDILPRQLALKDVRMRMVVATVRGTALMLLTAAGTGRKPWHHN